MLPRATAERIRARVGRRAGIGGRTHEIQRLIGRSLRGVVDLAKLGERTITVDCDVLQADGGTRTRVDHRRLRRARRGADHVRPGALPRRQGRGGAASGSSTALPLLDLDYSEDSHAEVDFNVVGTDGGTYVEIQGTAEGQPFDRARDERLLDLAELGPRAAVRAPGRGARHGPPLTARRGRPRIVVATRSAHKLRELRELLRARSRPSSSSLDDARRARRAGRGRRDVRGERPDQGPRLRPARPACRRSPTIRDRGRRARRRPGRPDPPLRRPERDRRREQRQAPRASSAGLPPARRGARYVCVLALAVPDPSAAGRPPDRDRPRDEPRPDRARAAREWRLRLRPDLRAGTRAARRADVRPVRRAEKDAISHRGRAARRMAITLADLGF